MQQGHSSHVLQCISFIKAHSHYMLALEQALPTLHAPAKHAQVPLLSFQATRPHLLIIPHLQELPLPAI